MFSTLYIVLTYENTLEKIPGLGSLVDKIGNSVAVFVMTTLEPFVKPLLGTATSALSSSSQAVIDTVDQYEVWNDWNASDPTHSFLSKDHFGLILNEPAGQIAKIIVQFSVERIVQAWGNTNANANQLVDEILQCLFHPDFVNRQSQIQTLMLEHMRKWLDSQGKDRNEILNRLTSDNVKAGKNRRIGDTSPEGHVHNSMLPEGGLQEVFQQHNVHVVGAPLASRYLCSLPARLSGPQRRPGHSRRQDGELSSCRSHLTNPAVAAGLWHRHCRRCPRLA